jgi:hypothetical protein
MIRIESEPPQRSACECCGKTTIRLTRFVYKDNNAYAVYYAAFTPEHSEKVVTAIIGLGEWGDDRYGPESRVAFPLEIRSTENQFQVGLVNAEASPWSHVTFLGRILNRQEALKHDWASDVFHITDHIVSEDQEVIRYFEESAA